MTNTPKKTFLNNEFNKIEVNKKTKYLAYKSIPEDDIEESNDDNFIPGKKNNINNNEEDINIDINESEYIGRKRELTNKNDEQKLISIFLIHKFPFINLQFFIFLGYRCSQ